MHKIAIVGLMKDKNLGEAVYPDCMSFLLSKNLKAVFSCVDFYGRADRSDLIETDRKTENLIYSRDLTLFEKVCLKIPGLFRHLKFSCFAKHLDWLLNPNQKRRLRKYYLEQIRGASLVIFAGGGIIECSSNHDYYHHIDLITRISEKLNIPVCFYGVGRVFDDKHQFGWGIMRKSLNRPCVKYFACRDGEDWINRFLFNGRAVAKTVPCSGILSKKVYGEGKKSFRKIGIGVIRGNIFESYGTNFDEEDLLALYQAVITRLLEKGYSCTIFSDGLPIDGAFGEKLHKRLNDKRVDFVFNLKTGFELAMLICSFDGIITARLHSCIVAYSYDVPTVCLKWQDKIQDFFTLIGRPENAINFYDFSAEKIILRFLAAKELGYDKTIRKKLEDNLYNGISDISNFVR